MRALRGFVSLTLGGAGPFLPQDGTITFEDDPHFTLRARWKAVRTGFTYPTGGTMAAANLGAAYGLLFNDGSARASILLPHSDPLQGLDHELPLGWPGRIEVQPATLIWQLATNDRPLVFVDLVRLAA